jgi:threonylcarbamoyladenosine tRNA methylthiotransferase MtaB
MDVLENPLFCPHWHLPLQAGSDRTLERMRRDYRVVDFLAVVGSLRARFPDPSFSTDVVVGFPGESEEDFSETLRVARQVGFSKMHVFPYSRREGTLASKLGGDLPYATVRRRARTLRRLEEELATAYKRRFVGRRVEVLVEGRARPSGDPGGLRWLEGLTDRYLRVRFPEPRPGGLERFRGTLVAVEVRAVEPAVARGEAVVAWVEPKGARAEPGGARGGEGP